MSLWLDISYLNQIAYRLDGWKEKSSTPHISNVRCSICGDSSHDRRKKRGYFFERGDSLLYTCKNCMSDESMLFSNYLKDFDYNLWQAYCIEKFTGTRKSISLPKQKKSESDIFAEQTFNGLPSLLYLANDHPAKKYMLDRKIPLKFISDFRYAHDFYKWAKTNTNVFDKAFTDHPRIIIPWYAENKTLIGYQARSINGEEPKYFTVFLKENYVKMYGAERLDRSKPVYVVEGSIDSIFLPNAVAVGSADLLSVDGDYYVYDNEKRNKEVCKMMKKAIDKGKKIFIPPTNYRFKDINEAIMGGLKQSEVKNIIDNNSYSGIMATIKFKEWVR